VSTDRFELGILALGALLVSAGGTLAGVYSFQNNYLLVFIGYVFFTAGYKISWYGTHSIRDPGELKDHLQNFGSSVSSHITGEFRNYSLIVLGLVFSTVGTVQFGEMVLNQFSPFGVAWAGVSCFGGYMVAHEGINEVLV
jgi:hypothetical protein